MKSSNARHAFVSRCNCYYRCSACIFSALQTFLLTFVRMRVKSSNVKSSMCSERTKHVWYKYYGLFFRVYITSQEINLSHINTRQTSFEACFDSKLKSRDCSAP